jgi:hypothetical protein
MLAVWILSVFYFALAAPVLAVREKLEVRSNAVDAFKDEIVVWEKRSKSPFAKLDDADATSEDEQNNDANMEYDASDSDSSSNDDAFDSDSSSSGDYQDNVSEDDDDGGYPDSDDYQDNVSEDGSGGYPDSDDYQDNVSEDDDERLPETPEHMTTMTDVEQLLDPLMHRPRNSGFGAVGSQRGVAENGRTLLTFLSRFK